MIDFSFFKKQKRFYIPAKDRLEYFERRDHANEEGHAEKYALWRFLEKLFGELEGTWRHGGTYTHPYIEQIKK